MDCRLYCMVISLFSVFFLVHFPSCSALLALPSGLQLGNPVHRSEEPHRLSFRFVHLCAHLRCYLRLPVLGPLREH